jgi:oligopeptide transport system substrate-binding protein
MLRKLLPVISIVVLASMLMTACQPETQTLVTVVAGTPVVKTEVVTATPPPPVKPKRPNVIRTSFLSGDVPTLDPALGEDTSSITIVEDTYVGLTRLDEVTGALHPGIATKWDISPDGTVYTFHLRNDVPWVKYDGAKKAVVKVQTCPDNDGKTKDRLVTAKDFEYGILRAIRPEIASPYAYVLAFVVQGADDYNAGNITDTAKVGVKALDDWTLEVKFKEPAAYNANIIGLWTAMPTPKWVIEGDDCTQARTDTWIEPGFAELWTVPLKEWIRLDGDDRKNRSGLAAKAPGKVDEVTFSMLDSVPQLAEFEAAI